MANPIMRFFEYEHLPQKLREISAPICEPPCVQQRRNDPQGDARSRTPNGPKKMNPRAWIVTKQSMGGDLYDALAWDNGGKPLGVSLTTPTPLYEGEAMRVKLTGLGDLLAVIHCDGGHYQAEHGTAMAIEDAIAVVHSIRAQNSAVDELAMLVRRLAHMLQNSSPEMDLPKKAMDYLKIAGLAGLPMRLVGDA